MRWTWSWLHGTELNIGPDGSVDWDANFLDRLDGGSSSPSTATRSSVSDLGNMLYGVGIGVGAAQRGWLTPDDVDQHLAAGQAARLSSAKGR